MGQGDMTALRPIGHKPRRSRSSLADSDLVENLRRQNLFVY